MIGTHSCRLRLGPLNIASRLAACTLADALRSGNRKKLTVSNGGREATPRQKKKGPVELSTQQKKVIEMAMTGTNVFFTGSAGALSPVPRESMDAHALPPLCMIDFVFQERASRSFSASSSRPSSPSTIPAPMPSPSRPRRELQPAMSPVKPYTPLLVSDLELIRRTNCEGRRRCLSSYRASKLIFRHSTFSAAKVRKNQKAMSRWMRTKVLIIDESQCWFSSR